LLIVAEEEENTKTSANREHYRHSMLWDICKSLEIRKISYLPLDRKVGYAMVTRTIN